MGLILLNTDFVTGDYLIAQTSYTLANLNAFIDKHEEEALIALLGKELFDLFEADVLNHVPQAARFVTIFEPMRTKDYKSLGIKEMLQGFVWYEYVTKQKVVNSGAGPQVAKSETGRESGFSEYNYWDSYNKAVNTHNNIQAYIEANLADYEEYEGECKEIIHWAL